MGEASKNLATKNQVETALYVRDKNRENDENESQKYLISQPVFKYFQIYTDIIVIDKMLGWKSKRLSEETITSHVTSDNNFASKLAYIDNAKIAVEFEVNCLK